MQVWVLKLIAAKIKLQNLKDGYYGTVHYLNADGDQIIIDVFCAPS